MVTLESLLSGHVIISGNISDKYLQKYTQSLKKNPEEKAQLFFDTVYPAFKKEIAEHATNLLNKSILNDINDNELLILGIRKIDVETITKLIKDLSDYKPNN